ncbi:MAG: hypothetical protein WAM39_07125 [Bryobacteraceae bacterium]
MQTSNDVRIGDSPITTGLSVIGPLTDAAQGNESAIPELIVRVLGRASISRICLYGRRSVFGTGIDVKLQSAEIN